MKPPSLAQVGNESEEQTLKFIKLAQIRMIKVTCFGFEAKVYDGFEKVPVFLANTVYRVHDSSALFGCGLLSVVQIWSRNEAQTLEVGH